MLSRFRKPLVLLAGDSISVGYTNPLREFLAGSFRVKRAPKAVTSAQIRDGIAAWLIAFRPTVVYFNCGLHDIWIKPNGTNTVAIKDYVRHIRFIVSVVLATKAIPIFATTTPLPMADPNRRPHDIDRYNHAAVAALGRLGAGISDLHDEASAMPLTKWEENGIHPNEEGYAILARRAADDIIRHCQISPRRARPLRYWLPGAKAV